MTNDQPQPKLIHVNRPLKRITLHFQPLVPPDGPVTDGPLIRVGHPLKRIKLSFAPVEPPRLGLRLTPGPDTDPAAMTRVFEKLLALDGGTGTAGGASVSQLLREMEQLGCRVSVTVEPRESA